MSESDGLAPYLEGYRSEGRLDSTGDFTLSDDRAQEKLREFRLVEPRLYVLNLQAAAVSGGAKWVDFRGDADDLYFACDADLGPSSALGQINTVATTDGVATSVRELALALNGCLPLAPKSLRVDYWDGEGGLSITREQDRFRYERLSEPLRADSADRQPTLAFHLREPIGTRTIGKFISRLGGAVATDSEQDLIARHCNRSPIPLRFNGREVRRPISLKGAEKAVVLLDGPVPKEHPLAPLRRVGSERPKEAYKAVLTRGGRLPPWLTVVLNGVSFRSEGRGLRDMGWRGVVYADGLRKDLSQCQLAQDSTYRRIQRDLELWARTK